MCLTPNGMRGVIGIMLLTVVGCGAPPPPEPEPEPEPKTLSYVEALQIYNQELAALDRLRAERDRLQQSLTPDATELVGGLLEDAGAARAELQQTLEDLDIADPDSAETGEDSLGQLGDQLRQAQQEREGNRDEVVARIAEIGQEIAEQQKRVDRAKVDKDAAEAAR